MPELFSYSYRLLNLNQAGTLTNFEYPIEGQKLIYMAPTDGPQLSIKLQAKSNDGIPLRPQGQIVAPFQRLYISGVIGAAFPVLIVASPASLSIESRDVNVNAIATLSTITNPVIAKDFVLDRALAGQIFERGDIRTAGAGTRQHFQIKNPVASGKTVVVLASSLVGGADIRYVTQYNTDLTTLVGTLYNVQSGGAASVAQFRTQANATILGNVLSCWRANVLSTPPLMPRVDVLDPGEGVVFVGDLELVQETFWARVYEF
jgi:hypothetical protein